jgi:hypothetical protein
MPAVGSRDLADAPPALTSPIASGRARRRPLRSVWRFIAAIGLGGLSTTEVLAFTIGFVAVMGLLWATGSVPPERLVTAPALRIIWLALAVALIRPVTWVPYLILFWILRWLVDAAIPRRSIRFRNAVGHVVAIAILAVAGLLALSAISEGSRWVLSLLGFASGSVGFAELGVSTGSWTAPRIAGLIAGLILVRPLIPPVGRDLSVVPDAVLGFPEGSRGRLDRSLLFVASGLGLVLGATAVLLAAAT